MPPLRFPEFSDEWTETNIGSILSICNGKDYKDLGNGNIPVFGTGGYMTSVNDYLMDGESVFIGRKGTINKPSYYKGKFWTVDTLFYTHEFIGAVPRFVLYLFENIDWLKYNEASGVPSLSKSTIEKIKINIPKAIEQKKISAFISLLDHRIEVQSGLIEDLQKLKAALVERLFCNKQSWKQYKYRDLLSPISERNSGNQFSNVLSASQELGMVSRTDLDIDIKFDRSAVTTYKIVRDGDYVLHLRSFQGGLAFSSMTGICSPAYTILRPVKELEYGFFQEYFVSKSFINSLRLVTYGIRDGRSINVDEFLDMTVEIPDSATQRRIISILSTMNRRLRLAIKQNENYIKQKQYLLQQLFI